MSSGFKHSLNGRMLPPRRTLMPFCTTLTSSFLNVAPIHKELMLPNLHHFHPSGISNGISSSIHLTSPVARNFS